MKNVFDIEYIEYGPIVTGLGVRPGRLGEHWLKVGDIAVNDHWLLFISCINKDTPALLKEVIPALLYHKVAFRIVKNQLSHYELNAGMLDGANFGKVVTIYPSSIPVARELVTLLLPVTSQYRGPVIDDSIQLGKNLYTGYVQSVDETGSPVNLSIPGEKKIPFAIDPRYPLHQKLGKKIGGGFYPYNIITSSYKSTLYRSANIKNLGLCLVKRGRVYVADDPGGRHIKHRLLWEKEVLERLGRVLRVPKNLVFFEVKGDPCLCMDFMEDALLQEMIVSIYEGGKTWMDLPGETKLHLLDVYLSIVKIIESLHQRGFIHRDITHANFMVPQGKKGDQRVCLIDAELMFDTLNNKPWPPFPLGTPGYAAPEQMSYESVPVKQSDIYSMSALLIFMVTGVDPVEFISSHKRETRGKLEGAGVDVLLIDCMMKGLSANPMERPAIYQIQKTITHEKERLYQLHQITPIMATTTTKSPVTFKGVTIELLCGLMALLFLYASVSKFLDMKQFTRDMNNQPFPHWLARVFVWTVPCIEILIVVGFIISAFTFEKLRTVMLWAFLGLMSLFTLYTGSILLHWFPRVPCSCGGVIKHLTWTQHLFLNLFFVIISIVAIVWRKKGTVKDEPVIDNQMILQTANV